MPTLFIYRTGSESEATDVYPLGSSHTFFDVVSLLDGDGNDVSRITAGWDDEGVEWD
jgi:hypothetical protein